MSKTLQIYTSSGRRGIGIWLNVHNGMHLELEQAQDDGMIEVRRMDGEAVDNTFTISPGDMVTLLNWLRFQKEKGNAELDF